MVDPMKLKDLLQFGRPAFVAALISIATLPVAAQQLTGTYGYTGTSTCFISPTGFNDNLTPVSGQGITIRTGTAYGTYTFKDNGTGTVQFHEARVSALGEEYGGGSSDDGTTTFTFTMGTEGAFTSKVQSVKWTMLTGPYAGKKGTTVGIPEATGQIAKNGSVVLTTLSPGVEKALNPSGVTVETSICLRTDVLFPIE
jgi:hypothetical protein